MKYFIVFFLIISTHCFSQKRIVIDSITKEALPYVLIKFDDDTGVYSNEQGLFNIKDNALTLQFEYSGYQAKTALVNSLKDTIKLQPKSEVLEELFINSLKENKKINSLKSPKVFGDCILRPESEIISTIIPNSEIENFFIDEVTFFFQKLKWSKNKDVLKEEFALVRVNIYDLKNKVPNNLLFSSKVFKINAYEKENLSIDLKNEFITFKNEGIAFAIEYIGNINKNGDFYTSNNIYLRPELAEDKSKYFKGNLLQKFQLKDKKENLIDLIAHWNEGFDYDMKITPRVLNISLKLSK